MAHFFKKYDTFIVLTRVIDSKNRAFIRLATGYKYCWSLHVGFMAKKFGSIDPLKFSSRLCRPDLLQLRR